jgi:cytochrome P450
MSQLLNPDIYAHSDQSSGYRYIKLRQDGGKRTSATSAVSTSGNHLVFGMGRCICPGHFFAVAKVKTAFAVVLLQYDVRLKPG